MQFSSIERNRWVGRVMLKRCSYKVMPGLKRAYKSNCISSLKTSTSHTVNVMLSMVLVIVVVRQSSQSHLH